MKRLVSLLLACILMVSLFSFPVSADTAGQLIIYPEYPEELPRNYDYEVEVIQGDKSYKIPVYDSARVASSFSGGDGNNHRRFSEFAFEGEVTVKVTTRLEVDNYVLMPTVKGIDSTFSDGTITFTLTKPETVVIRLNEEEETQFTIFAEAPETDVPDADDENVMYFKAGLNNSDKYQLNEEAQLDIPAGTHVYLEPGALVQARMNFHGGDITVSGRGAFIDPRTDRAGSGYMVDAQGHDDIWENIKLEGVRFLDAHGFNVAFRNVRHVHVDGIKILSNQISSDGISFWNGLTEDALVENCYIQNHDDNFVLNNVDELTIRNCIISDTHAFVIPQGDAGTILLEDMYVIDSASFLKSWVGIGDTSTWENVTLRNIHAEDALTLNYIISMREQPSGKKNITLENIALPKDAVKTVWFWLVPDLTVNFNNVFIGGEEVRDSSAFDTYTIENATINYGTSFDAAKANVGTYDKMKKVVSYDGAPRVYMGDYEIPNAAAVPFTEDGEIYLPAVETLSELGYDANYKDGVLTFSNLDGESEMKVGRKKISYIGHAYTMANAMREENGCAMIPASFLKELGYDVKASGKDYVIDVVNNGQNLIHEGDMEGLINPAIPNFSMSGIENIYSRYWNAFNFGKVKITSKDAHSGQYAMKVSQTSAGTGESGVAQLLAHEIAKYGAGTYHIELWARLGDNVNPENPNVEYGIVTGSYMIYENGVPYSINDFTSAKLTASWQKLTYDVVITDPDAFSNAYFYIGSQAYAGATTVMDFYLDDVSVTFSKRTTSSNLTDTLSTNATQYGAVLKGWYDAAGKTYTKSTLVSGTVLLSPRFTFLGEGIHGLVDAEGVETDTQPVKADATYTNGFYVQGAQARVGVGSKTLRFVIAKSNSFEEALRNEGFRGITYGTLVAYADNAGLTLTVEDAQAGKAKDVITANTWYEGGEYTKYTIHIADEDMSTEITVRPYVKYTDSSGMQRVIYGQACTSSLISAYAPDEDLGSDVKRYAYSSIMRRFSFENTVSLKK